jgi:hypothetical protein
MPGLMNPMGANAMGDRFGKLILRNQGYSHIDWCYPVYLGNTGKQVPSVIMAATLRKLPQLIPDSRAEDNAPDWRGTITGVA